MHAMNRDDLLARVAWLYYVESLTHQEIGERLNLPRVKVTRLLKEARDEGIIEFRIAKSTTHLELEGELRQQLGLKDAWLASTPLDASKLRRTLGEAAARYLDTLFRPGMVVGLGMGRTLAMIPRFVERNRTTKCTFVEMVGGASDSDLGVDTYNVSWRLAELCGGEAEHVFSPLMVKSAVGRDALMQDPQIASALKRAAACDVALVGIGNVADDMLMRKLGYYDEATVLHLRPQGAVGDVLGHFFDGEGKPVVTELDERLIALSLDQLAAIPTVIAIAGGADKVRAIFGAIRGGYINVFVSDTATAQALLRASQRSNQHRSAGGE
ncbi:MAG: sugar-binding transcriptional regulator [Chloroflexi bacterium]|nr:sugar-binding transcriptional regulator [Chloroflexota bacterium]